MSDRYGHTQLTDEEMIALDDGQGWWEPGDKVFVGCYVPDEHRTSPIVDLGVNGETVDNWTHWEELPEAIRARITADAS